MNQITPDGKIVAAILAVSLLLYLLWILSTARKNGGVAELPPPVVSLLLFGFGGGALTPNLIIIRNDHRNKGALIAHERCHQRQMLADGYLTWLRRYVFDLRWRQQYEVEAYRVWVQHSPADLQRCAFDLVHGYDLDLTTDAAMHLLLPKPGGYS